MRVKLKELNFSRVYKAILRRVVSVPKKLSWSFSGKGRENKFKLYKYKDFYKGQRCFLVANGPSLKKMDLSFLKDEISFGLNRIYLAYEDMNFTNNYLVSINGLVLSQFNDEIQNLKMPKFINWESKNYYKDDSTILYIYKQLFGSNFGKDISKSVNPAATVTYAALQIIYYMGFTEVVIIGMDHNFTTKTKNEPNKTEVRDEEEDVNHFHPNYFPKGTKWETPDLVSSEYFYSIARQEFEKDNRRIIDCTIDGKCEVFEKGNYQDFVNQP
jgi:hypothetical protein